MGRRSKPPQQRPQPWLTANAASLCGVVALAVAAALLLGVLDDERPRVDDRTALSNAEDLLQSVAERASALRDRGVFFGAAYSELLPDAERAETLLLEMLKPDAQALLASHRMVAHTAMSAGDGSLGIGGLGTLP